MLLHTARTFPSYFTCFIAFHQQKKYIKNFPPSSPQNSYQQQHQAFIHHADQQILMIETQIQQLEQQSLNQQQIANIPPLMAPIIEQQQTTNGNLIQQQNNQMNNNRNDSYEMMTHQNSFQSNQNNFQMETKISISSDFTLPPPNFLIPDLSKPPPNFTQNSDPEDLTPTVPYFELPAGLVVSLIKLEDYGYKPLDSSLIKLPPPTPPSERLLGAVEAFYSPPSHDRPRDGDGWEKLGLYEYYKVKNAAKKQKEEEIETGVRQPSRSPSPIEIQRPKSNKRRYRSKSRSRSRSKSPPGISMDQSVPPPPPPPAQSQMPNRSPLILESRRNSSNRRMQRRSPSPSSQQMQKCRNESPPIMKRDRPRSRGRVDKERMRSVSPPSFL